MQYPPNNYKELLKLLHRLGFERVHSGKHGYKLIHPTRKPKDLTKRPFIVISTGRDKTYSKIVLKEVKNTFGFTEKEIKAVC